MEPSKILVVDDDREIVTAITKNLEAEGYAVFQAYDGLQALELMTRETIHLVLLDIMMPNLDGLSATMKIREKKNIPIILLSAKSEDSDKVLGLTMGADDYMTKPFLPLELVARVKAQLRRYKRYNTGISPEDHDILVHSGLVLNTTTHACALNEKPLSPTPTEFNVRRILCQEKGNVVSSEELFHQIWGDEYYSKNNNTITVHIRHLREKMGDSFDEPKYIKTVWGVGYKIEK